MSNLELIARHLTTAELEAGLDEIRRAPRDEGTLELIVRRPEVDEREVLDAGELSLELGLVGDGWITRGSSRTPDGSSHPDMQLNIMNSRVTALVAQHKDRWQLAGDQLYLDMDLSEDNLPAGTRFAIGAAVIEVSPQPHLGCRKFVSRSGLAAMQFVISGLGGQRRRGGIKPGVVSAAVIRVGEVVGRFAGSRV